MTNETDVTKMDKRIMARLLRKGALVEKEVEKALKALPDLADKSAPVETAFEETAGKGVELEGR